MPEVHRQRCAKQIQKPAAVILHTLSLHTEHTILRSVESLHLDKDQAYNVSCLHLPSFAVILCQ